MVKPLSFKFMCMWLKYFSDLNKYKQIQNTFDNLKKFVRIFLAAAAKIMSDSVDETGLS